MIHILITSVLLSSAVAQQVNDGYWTKVANMPIARSDIGSSTLGDAIILTGGCLGPQVLVSSCTYSCANVTSRVEAFFPANNSFVRLADLPRPRFRHSSEVIDGKLYVIGGRTIDTDAIIGEVDVYDPKTSTWSTSSFNMNGGTSDFSTFVKDDLIYMVGGYYQDYVISTAVATFSPKTGFNFNALAPMVDARGDTCSVYYNGSIYVIGGFDPSSGADFSKPVDTLEIYNFTTGRWSYGAVTLQPGGDKACGILNDRIRAFGGEGKVKLNDQCFVSSPEDDTEEYDFTTGRWSQEPAMSTSRFRFAAEYFQTNVLYVFGGQGQRNTTGDFYPTLSTVEVWTDTRPGTGTASGLLVCASLLLLCLVSTSL